MKISIMKTILIFIGLVTFSISKAQDNADLKSVLKDGISNFSAEAAAEVKELNDGATRGSREYKNGDQSLRIRISCVAEGKEQETSVMVEEILTSFDELGESGRMDTQRLSGDNFKLWL